MRKVISGNIREMMGNRKVEGCNCELWDGKGLRNAGTSGVPLMVVVKVPGVRDERVGKDE